MKISTLQRIRALALNPAVRVAMGLSSLVVTILLVADLAFGLIPDQTGLVRQLRERISENLAIQTAALMDAGDLRTLDRVYREQLSREKTMLSVAVRRLDGRIVMQAGDHAASWVPPVKGKSSMDHIQVPLVMNNQRWGAVEISFRNAAPASVGEWLRQPELLLMVLLGCGCFLAFVLYLRRVLSHLDPSTVIPDRVRSAFDVFSGGVMIVDGNSRVMLVNASLRRWIGPSATGSLVGKAVESVPWFRRALPNDRAEHPWVRCMASATVVEGEHLEFHGEGDVPIRVIANCAPILDGPGKVRGCMVTFDNVTHLDQLNSQLLASMAELTNSQHEIEKKNEELLRLATRDPLTGCFNRRALFEKLELLFQEAREQGTSLCCIMTDIDHFKSFNDRYGHAVGDQVLQATAHKLGAALRDMDILARYGGEEFCIILPGVSVEQAAEVAERLRGDVETQAGSSVRSTPGLKITSSFGVSIFAAEMSDPAQLIDHADQALYAAKKGGRNCVRSFDEIAAVA
jgi:diguanylate cyclase (GGDEF)-like protein